MDEWVGGWVGGWFIYLDALREDGVVAPSHDHCWVLLPCLLLCFSHEGGDGVFEPVSYLSSIWVEGWVGGWYEKEAVGMSCEG